MDSARVEREKHLHKAIGEARKAQAHSSANGVASLGRAVEHLCAALAAADQPEEERFSEELRDEIGSAMREYWHRAFGGPLSMGRSDDLAGVALVELGADPSTFGWNHLVWSPSSGARGEGERRA